MGPTPPPQPQEKCDQTECQDRNRFFGNIYCKIDGKTYQRYRECNCRSEENVEKCVCNSIEKEVPSGTISGHVYDAETKKPIFFATLVIKSCTMSSNAEGYYVFSNCSRCPFLTIFPLITYTLTCCVAGYAPETKTVMTNKYGNAVVDFYLYGGMPEFQEDFNLEISPNFNKPIGDAKVENSYLNLILLKKALPPKESGSSIQSRNYCIYGTYKAKLRAANCLDNEGVVSAFHTYRNALKSEQKEENWTEIDWNKVDWSKIDENNNNIADNSEIDFEILGYCPSKIYMTIWTDYQWNDANKNCEKDTNEETFSRSMRIVDLATGRIWESASRDKYGEYEITYLPKDLKERPQIIGFDASKDYYEYGFTWSKNFVKFFILDKNNKKIELWNYAESQHIPTHPAWLMSSVWYTNNWRCVSDIGGELTYPSQGATLLDDWTKYSPEETC